MFIDLISREKISKHNNIKTEIKVFFLVYLIYSAKIVLIC